MNFLKRFFDSNKVECPRCLGKGVVEWEDIKRLKMDLLWAPGRCAYCNGKGKVTQSRVDKLAVDTAYLTIDISDDERRKLYMCEPDAIERANEFNERMSWFISEIENLYYIKNLEQDEIAEYLFHKQEHFTFTDEEKQDLVDYINRVIQYKRRQ